MVLSRQGAEAVPRDTHTGQRALVLTPCSPCSWSLGQVTTHCLFFCTVRLSSYWPPTLATLGQHYTPLPPSPYTHTQSSPNAKTVQLSPSENEGARANPPLEQGSTLISAAEPEEVGRRKRSSRRGTSGFWPQLCCPITPLTTGN